MSFLFVCQVSLVIDLLQPNPDVQPATIPPAVYLRPGPLDHRSLKWNYTKPETQQDFFPRLWTIFFPHDILMIHQMQMPVT